MHFLTPALLAAGETATKAKDGWISDLIKVAPALAWVILALYALIVFRAELKFLLEEIVWRIKAGAAFKLASIEVGAPYVSHQQQEHVAGIEIQADSTGEFAKQREPFKTKFRNLSLVSSPISALAR